MTSHTKQGTAYIINGPCSAGKSTAAKALQELLPTPNIHLGIDTFHLAIPPNKLSLGSPDPQYLQAHQYECDGKICTEIKHGPIIHRINKARFNSVCCFLDAGIDVVADELLWTKEDVIELLFGLQGHNVYLIGFHIDENEGSRRESARMQATENNATDNYQSEFRPTGMSRASAKVVHQHMQYDLELDSTSTDPQSLARDILQMTQSKQPEAFPMLCRTLC